MISNVFKTLENPYAIMLNVLILLSYSVATHKLGFTKNKS